MFPPRLNLRTSLAFGHDLVAAALAWCLAYWLRFNMEFEEPYLQSMLQTLPWVVLSQGCIFLWFGLYRGIWRHASLPDQGAGAPDAGRAGPDRRERRPDSRRPDRRANDRAGGERRAVAGSGTRACSDHRPAAAARP